MSAAFIRSWYMLVGFASASGVYLQHALGGVWWLLSFFALIAYLAGDEPISTGVKN